MKRLLSYALAAAVSLTMIAPAAANELVTAANVDTIKNQVPDFLYDWVKEGKAEVRVVTLPFAPEAAGYGLFPEDIAASKANAGKYTLNDKRELVDASGTVFPRNIKGLPFPDINPEEPNAGSKVAYNGRIRDTLFWPANATAGYHAQTADSGQGIDQQAVRMSIRGTGQYDFMFLQAIKAPYNIAGTVLLDARQLDPNGPAMRYVYNVGTRKTMRFPTKYDATEHNAGTAMCEDDQGTAGTGYRVANTVYKFIGAKEMLVPYMSVKPTLISPLPNGGYRLEAKTPEDGIIAGYTDPNWKGYAWWPLNIVFAKRTVWEFSFDQVDENPDRYGTDNRVWIDPVTNEFAYKRIVDPENKLFRGLLGISRYCETADKKLAFTRMFTVLSVNVQDDMLATCHYQMHKPGFFYEFKLPEGRIDERFFTKDGMVKFGK